MTGTVQRKKLEKFYQFFETYGAERLKGLDDNYLRGLDGDDKEEAWNFLVNGFSESSERINALYALDRLRAADLFKKVIGLPTPPSEFAHQRESIERNRLLMLRYINSVEFDEKNIVAMTEFARSQFTKIRAEFAQYLPVQQATDHAVEALKTMIFTEAERIPLSSAITKFMAIHGMEYDLDNPLYKSIYLSLRADDPKEKLSGMRRLEACSSRDQP